MTLLQHERKTETDSERQRETERETGRGRARRDCLAFCVLALLSLSKQNIFCYSFAFAFAFASSRLVLFVDFWQLLEPPTQSNNKNCRTTCCMRQQICQRQQERKEKSKGKGRKGEWHATRSSGEACQVNNLITTHKSLRAIDRWIIHIWSGIGLSL